MLALRAGPRRLPRVRSLPHLCPSDGTRRRAARRHQVFLVVPPTPQAREGGNHGEKGLRAKQMTMTDPIADMLTRLRNANSAYHDTVAMPYSKIKTHIAEILQQEGYIAGWNVDDNTDGPGKTLTVTLKFGQNRERSIGGIRRISKPGLR